MRPKSQPAQQLDSDQMKEQLEYSGKNNWVVFYQCVHVLWWDENKTNRRVRVETGAPCPPGLVGPSSCASQSSNFVKLQHPHWRRQLQPHLPTSIQTLTGATFTFISN